MSEVYFPNNEDRLEEIDEEDDRKIEWMERQLPLKLYHARTRPVSDIKPVLEDLFRTIPELGDPLLEKFLTKQALEGVSAHLKRLKELSALDLEVCPDDRVQIYYQQASICYLHGLYDAVAILSRSVLQFALEEAFQSRDALLPSSEGENLRKLVDWALACGVLSDELATISHNIRKNGNEAVHKGSCSQADARIRIKETAEVLKAIYV